MTHRDPAWLPTPPPPYDWGAEDHEADQADAMNDERWLTERGAYREEA